MKKRTAKIAKLTPRCPLCHAEFDRREIPTRKANILKMIAKANADFEEARSLKDVQKLKDATAWGEQLEASLKAGAAEAFLCHFCKISIGVNDPFVGRWDEAYAKGEKILCPACDHEMRFFCTSTGYMLAQCPVKKCRSRMELSAPDRKEGDAKLYDAAGQEIAVVGVDRPIATPEAPAVTQVMGSGKAEGLPDVTEIPKP